MEMGPKIQTDPRELAIKEENISEFILMMK